MVIASPPRRRLMAPPVLVWAVIALAGLLAVQMLLTTVFADRAAVGRAPQAAFFARAIDEALARLDHLPFVLARDPGTIAALRGGTGADLNPTLEGIAARAEAEFVFVMDTTGLTLASSNWRTGESLVGRTYTFRPYFQDALAGGTGRFFAVGVTTSRPGFFIAEPVRDTDGTVLGVVVVKIGLEDLSSALSGSGELVLVTGPNGIVLIASDPALAYGLTRPLSDQTRARMAQERRFGDRPLRPLEWQQSTPGRVLLGGTDYLEVTARLTREDWTVRLLTEMNGIRLRAASWVAVALAIVLMLGIAAAVARAVQLRRALAASDADRRRLAHEIEERRLAEAQLRAAQSELARRSRLAALGQLAASVTHELGQPISAMRNYLTAEEIAADRLPGDLSPRLSGLLARMQWTIDQLRSFGREDPAAPRSCAVAEVVSGAVALVRHSAEGAGVTLTAQPVDTTLVVGGDPRRVEQVLVNLLRNAIDAAEDGPTPGRVTIAATRAGGHVDIQVEDSGPGIGTLDIDDLQEPFYTTKPPGQGMGLGLAISAQIVRDLGGQLTARNGPSGSGVFTLRLGRQKEPQ